MSELAATYLDRHHSHNGQHLQTRLYRTGGDKQGDNHKVTILPCTALNFFHSPALAKSGRALHAQGRAQVAHACPGMTSWSWLIQVATWIAHQVLAPQRESAVCLLYQTSYCLIGYPLNHKTITAHSSQWGFTPTGPGTCPCCCILWQ